MPGERAEIAIAPPPSGGDYALTQLGFASGGDVWPAVRLANISFPVAIGHTPKPIELHGEPRRIRPSASTPRPTTSPAGSKTGRSDGSTSSSARPSPTIDSACRYMA